MSNANAMRNVELFASGTYRGRVYTPADVDAIAANNRKLAGYLQPPAVIGHEETDAFGEPTAAPERTDIPADGWVDPASLRTDWKTDPVTGQKSRVLYGDITDINDPGLIRDLNSRRFRKVSAEIYDDFLDNTGRSHGLALRRVSLLGGEVPQVKGLADLPALSFAEVRWRPIGGRPSKDRLSFLCFAEVTMDRQQLISAITTAMPGLNPATLESLSDDQLADFAKNIPSPTLETPVATMADVDRNTMIAALVAAGEDSATLDAMPDEDLATLYAAIVPPEEPVPDPAAVATMGDPATMTREELIAELVAAGEDQATLDALTDEELRAKLGGSTTEATTDTAAATPSVATMAERRARAAARLRPVARPNPVIQRFNEQVRAMKAMTDLARRQSLQTKRVDAVKFCEDLVREGKVLPAHKAVFLNTLLKAEHLKVHRFTEGGKTYTRTEYEQLKATYARFPVIKRFSERIPQSSEQTAEREIAAVQKFAEVHGESLRKAGTSPEKYVQDFRDLRKKNPRLTASQYGVPAEYGS